MHTPTTTSAPGSGRKTLAESLRARAERAGAEQEKGDVYRRSLMWERIPEEVVAEFRRMVRLGDGEADGAMKEEE